MAIDILDPNYWITELFGSVIIFAVLMTVAFLYLGSKLKLNFQWNIAILTMGFLMLPIVFEGFLSWIPLIIIIIGIVGGTIFYRFIDRT